MEQTKPYTTLSKIVSGILNPLIVPTYIVIIFFFSQGLLNAMPPKLKWLFIGQIALNTLIIPMTAIWVMKRLHVISDLDLSKRKERFIPLLLVAVCYTITLFTLPDTIISIFVSRFLYATLGVIVLMLAVSPFWKMSMHAAGMGGGLALLLAIKGAGMCPMCIIYIWIVLSGFVCSARLYLGAHSPAQVWIGYAAGFTVAYSVMEVASAFSPI